MSEKKDDKKIQDQLDRLTSIVEKLAELQFEKRQEEQTKEQTGVTQREKDIQTRREREELEEELKQYPVGELIIFALKKGLIKKGSLDEVKDE